jgi:hypothetical protein
MPLQRRYVGTQEGTAVFTNGNTGDEFSVDYRLDEEEKFIDYRDGREASAGSELVGEMWPVPDDVQFPSGPHEMKLEDGRTLKCWALAHRGRVRCT